MENIIDRYNDAVNKLNEVMQQQSRKEGILESLYSDLQNRGYKNAKDAEKAIARIERDLQNNNDKLEELLLQVEEELALCN